MPEIPAVCKYCGEWADVKAFELHKIDKDLHKIIVNAHVYENKRGADAGEGYAEHDNASAYSRDKRRDSSAHDCSVTGLHREKEQSEGNGESAYSKKPITFFEGLFIPLSFLKKAWDTSDDETYEQADYLRFIIGKEPIDYQHENEKTDDTADDKREQKFQILFIIMKKIT